MKEYVINRIRVQYICPGIVRIERAVKGTFCDQNTLVVPDRASIQEPTEWTIAKVKESLRFGIEGYKLYIPKTGTPLSEIYLTDPEGRIVYRYRKKRNSGELPTADHTPTVFALADDTRVLVPWQGYSYQGDKKDNGFVIQENVDDVYLLLCRKDAKLLRRLYVWLTGRSELVRLSTLGLWDSRYYVYSDKTARERIASYAEHSIPLDNMVIDTDWRKASDRGIGYEVNTELFPDLKDFFAYAHSQNINIMFNDHPEPLEGAKNLLSPKEVKYREENLQRLLSLGLDMWWYDRNWITSLKSPVSSIAPETWGMYIFSEITKNYYQKRDGKYYFRPDIMANVNNISHGSYSGAYGNSKNKERRILDSISHRYSIQWTGDISSDYRSLGREVGNMLGGGNSCIPYVNADCGGHTGNPDKETYIRWMQFGAFSPVFRPHCTKGLERTREPWAYDEETLDIVREYINLRYRLLPVIYREAFESYRNGTPIFQPLAFEFPKDKKATVRKDEYMLGQNILIAPIADYSEVAKVPPKNYTHSVKATYYEGTSWSGKILTTTTYKVLYKYWNNEKPHPKVPAYNFSARYETSLKFDKDVILFVASDDGVIVYLDGKMIYEDRTMHGEKRVPVAKLYAGKEYQVRIDYFQGGGKAAIALLYALAKKTDIDERELYLPQGKWMDAFTGDIYKGETRVRRRYGIREMPLFLRLGALLPLAYDAKNTKEQKWDRLCYDFYPSKEAKDEGELYEDDTFTTAYKSGSYRMSPYEAFFVPKEKAFVVRLHASEGDFEGPKAFSSREIAFRINLTKEVDYISEITINGEEYNFTENEKDSSAFPMTAGGATPDGKTVQFSLTIDVKKEYEIKFFL